MKKTKYKLSLMLIMVVFHFYGFGQIKVVDDEYQPNLGEIEETKLEDLDSVPKEVRFDFSVGDSIYVLNSSHKMLCLNKNNRQASIKSLKKGMYVVTGICFGDSIDRIHTLIDKYTFKNKNDRIEAHAIVYGMRIPATDTRNIYREKFNDRTNRYDYVLVKGYPLCSDTTDYGGNRSPYDNRAYHANELVSFYQSKQSKEFLDRMYLDKDEIKRTGRSTPTLLIGVIYRIENESGEEFFVDKREIGFQGEKNIDVPIPYNTLYTPKKIIVLKMSEHQKAFAALVGKEVYLSLKRGSVSYNDRIKQVKDYITGKDIKITIASGDMLYDAIEDNLRFHQQNNYSEESYKGLDDYYHCKDLFIQKGKTVVILSNELGEFSLQLNSLNRNNDYYSVFVSSKNSGGLELNLVPKDLIDNRLTNWQLSEQERKLKEQKEKEEWERKQKQYRENIIAKYGEVYGNKILQHKVAIGMTKEMCLDAWWFPNDTYKNTTNNGVIEVWVINYKTRLYFLDNKLYMIEE